MDMQKTYIWRPGRQIHSFCKQFLGLMSLGILAKLHPIIWSCISVWLLSCKFLQHFENTFFKNTCVRLLLQLRLRKIPSQLLEIFQKIVSLSVKLEIKCRKWRKERFQKQPVVILFKNDSSVRHMFCTILFLNLWPNFLKNTFEVVHT